MNFGTAAHVLHSRGCFSRKEERDLLASIRDRAAQARVLGVSANSGGWVAESAASSALAIVIGDVVAPTRRIETVSDAIDNAGSFKGLSIEFAIGDDSLPCGD